MSDSSEGKRAPQDQGSRGGNALALPVWLAAGAVPFLPFAFDTSPWDAVLLRVPGNQGNWWHLLAAAPFFLAYPMIWLRLRALFARQSLSMVEQCAIRGVVVLSMGATIAVETPFLLHLAGTSEWQRFAILSLGLGIILFSLLVLLLRRRRIPAQSTCIAGLDSAYLANAVPCLIVYAEAAGGTRSRLGWFVSMVLIWPIAFELAGILLRTVKTAA